MICAHDLFTYGSVDNNFPNGDLFRSYKGLWKCQERNEQQLYDMGVRTFYCRVYWDDGHWRAAHGAVNFQITFIISLQKNQLTRIYIHNTENLLI